MVRKQAVAKALALLRQAALVEAVVAQQRLEPAVEEVVVVR